jgi:hypothetical protein
MTNETQFVKWIRGRFTPLGYTHKFCEKFHSGWPDLVFIGGGQTFFVECKFVRKNIADYKGDPAKLLTPLQETILKKICNAGGAASLYVGFLDTAKTCKYMHLYFTKTERSMMIGWGIVDLSVEPAKFLIVSQIII